jgi:hypothetical protein
MDVQPFYDKGSHRYMWAGSRAARANIIISGIPNRINYCLLFIEYTQLTDVAAGSIIQPGEMHATCGPTVTCVGHCVSIVFRIDDGTKEVPKHVADCVSIVLIVQCT